jgi:hypothetical protein
VSFNDFSCERGKEIKKVVDLADQKPEGTIFIIPLRLEECAVPISLNKWHYVDYFPDLERENSFQRLLVSLQYRAKSIKISTGFQSYAEKNTISVTPRHMLGGRESIVHEKANSSTETSDIEIRLKIQEEIYLLEQLRRIRSRFVFRPWFFLRKQDEDIEFTQVLENEIWNDVPRWEKISSYVFPLFETIAFFAVWFGFVTSTAVNKIMTSSLQPTSEEYLTIGGAVLGPFLIIFTGSFLAGSLRKKSITPILEKKIASVEVRISRLRNKLKVHQT